LSARIIGAWPLTATKGQRHFGQLRGFARARFAAHDDDLMRLHGGHDFLASGRDGQRFWKFNLERQRLWT
jgi:hypothetical protein